MCKVYFFKWPCEITHKHWLTIVYCEENPFWKLDVRNKQRFCPKYEEVPINFENNCYDCPGTDTRRGIFDPKYPNGDGPLICLERVLIEDKEAPFRKAIGEKPEVRDRNRKDEYEKYGDKEQTVKDWEKCVAMRDLLELAAIERQRSIENDYLENREPSVPEKDLPAAIEELEHKIEEEFRKKRVTDPEAKIPDGPGAYHSLQKLEELHSNEPPSAAQDIHWWFTGRRTTNNQDGLDWHPFPVDFRTDRFETDNPCGGRLTEFPGDLNTICKSRGIAWRNFRLNQLLGQPEEE